MSESLIISRELYSSNHQTDTELAESFPQKFPHYRHTCGLEQGADPPCRIDNSLEVSQSAVGDKVTYEVGAPGYGHRTYQIIRIDEQGAWGEIFEDNSGIFEPEDVI